MLRGVSFEENNAGNVFCHLSTAIDILPYDWYIDDVDLNYFYFRPGKYSGKEFNDALNSISELSFARIRRYPVAAQVDCIDEYDDFAKSDCDLLMLFYDGGFYEVYAKKKETISGLMDFCLKSGFEKVEYIRDFDDPRSYMHF